MTSIRTGNIIITGQECRVFLGMSGSGKTGLARNIVCCGIHEGLTAIYVGAEAQQDLLDEEYMRDESDFINEVDQGRSVYDYLAESAGTTIIHDTLHLFGLHSLAHQGLKFLSTGELRKVLLANAYLKNPDILVLDDPYDGLDTSFRSEWEKMLGYFHERGMTLVFMLSRIAEIPVYAEKISFLKDGRSVLEGGKEILASDTFRQLYHLHLDIPANLPGMNTTHTRQENSKNGQVLVSIRNLHISWHCTDDSVKTVFRNFNFTLKEGEHLTISGPNGAGKSTLLALVTGDHPQCYANDITVLGYRRGSGESVWDLKKNIGLVSSAFQSDYRVRSTVRTVMLSGFYDTIGLYTRPSPTEISLAEEWLSLIGMSEKADTPFQELSFGRKRMVLIARSMIKHPRLLILDEPCQGIDPVHREMILRLIDIIASRGRTTILYVTHHAEDIIPSITRNLFLSPAMCLGESAS